MANKLVSIKTVYLASGQQAAIQNDRVAALLSASRVSPVKDHEPIKGLKWVELLSSINISPRVEFAILDPTTEAAIIKDGLARKVKAKGV